MRTGLQVTIFVVSLCLIISCSIQKRVYRNGYYIEWNTNKSSSDTNHLSALKAEADTAADNHCGEKALTSRNATGIADTVDPVVVGNANSGPDSAGPERWKDRIPKREDVYKYRQLSFWASGLGAGGIGITIAGVSAFSMGIFLIGFMAVGISLILAMYILYRINRLTNMFPDLRWPGTSRNSFESPYANKTSDESEMLWRMQKARIWAIILSWLILVVVGTCTMLVFAI